MNKILLTAAALLLTACGFHLKGTPGTTQPLPYQTWSVNGNIMQQALENALRRADGKPESAAKAQAELNVIGIQTRRDVYTITRAALINEYLLMLRVEVQVSRKGEPVGKPIRVEVYRTMDYSDSEVLGKAEEEQTIWSEMRADAADQIVRQLAFLNSAAQ
ncbi:LPS-assembly lipoprotein LptE [Neisseria perflava]|uniref:LPS-assembly lipoprotein LptE n=1 Tax=Neisseria perflava TaxID=33053 RepID=UPI0020A01769|nr:LPS assembly lipoprotein LptE [Neisseria perflava]MCP1661277.1 LPS-assembly lipoprotein [Neisseria perflava]MCP1773378.1 LPS-assembly lipoprotein [Neisseria perflava]